jgi:hypothetical protein
MTYVPKPVSRIYLCKKCRRAYLEEDIKAEHLTPEKLFEIIHAGMSPPQRRPYTQEDIDKALKYNWICYVKNGPPNNNSQDCEPPLPVLEAAPPLAQLLPLFKNKKNVVIEFSG